MNKVHICIPKNDYQNENFKNNFLLTNLINFEYN